MKKFAFLIHPREISDVAKKFWIMKILPDKIIKKLLLRIKSGIICSKFSVFGEKGGYILGVPLTARQMKESPRLARQKILEAILVAQDEIGIEVIGLGALTASFTRNGLWVAQHPKVKASITHGDNYAVAISEDAIEKIIDLSEFDRERVNIAIVGATGTIGEALAEIFVQKGYQLTLIGRNEVKLDVLKEKLGKKTVFTSIELEDIYSADIVITATCSPEALIKAKHLKQGAIVYDVAQPINVSSEVVAKRPDIIRIDGGYARVDGIKIGFDMDLAPGVVFSCLAETIMEALEDSNSNYVGKINLENVQKTRLWARKYGFGIAPFSCFNNPISCKRFQKVSQPHINRKFYSRKI